MTFGSFVREKRLSKDIGLRRFCLAVDIDPSTWSKVERDVTPPTQNKAKLHQVATILGLNTEEENELMDLASIAAQRIPDSVYADDQLNQLLPAFFRTIKDFRPSEEEFREYVARLIKSEQTSS